MTEIEIFKEKNYYRIRNMSGRLFYKKNNKWYHRLENHYIEGLVENVSWTIGDIYGALIQFERKEKLEKLLNE